MIDLVEDYRIGTEERIINNLVKKEIESFLCEKLTPRDQKIIEYRCGINGRRYTLEEVGDIFGITRERVRQIQKKTIQRMKTNKKIMELV